MSTEPSTAITTSATVLIETSLGNFRIALYDDTPLHRDNFLKLAEEGFYNDTLFHRVVKGFMIQGGDPDSRTAQPGQQLGTGGPGYTVPAEIIYPKYFHKRGALAAARQPDRVNPERRSSGSQFYIVWGSVLTDELMTNLENLDIQKKQEAIFNRLAAEYKEEADEMHRKGDHESMMKLEQWLSNMAREEANEGDNFHYTAEERRVYTSLGGSPFLDREYTVFGEVIEGLDVVEKIQLSRTAPGDRPIEDIKVKMTVVRQA